MRTLINGLLITLLLFTVSDTAEAARCKRGAVAVGTTCMDKYEASVWTVDPAEPQLGPSLKKLQRLAKSGTATYAKVSAIPGAKLVGAGINDYGVGCPNTGNGCTDYFALSIPGVTPSIFITWFQAVAACRNSGKELPTNMEWQAAAFGTPDGAPCIVDADDIEPTGTIGCESDVGASDMVGNVWEWVADWMQDNTDRDNGSFASATYGNDLIAGIDEADPDGERMPAAVLRGGGYNNGASAGVFALVAHQGPARQIDFGGFRCAR